MTSLVRLALLLAATATVWSQELVADGGFDSDELRRWKIARGTLTVARDEEGNGHGICRPVDGLVTVHHLLPGDLAGATLVIRGRFLMSTPGTTTQIYVMTNRKDWETVSWRAEVIPEPAAEWQDFALVVTIPDDAPRVFLGLLHRGEEPVLIDDWSARLRR